MRVIIAIILVALPFELFAQTPARIPDRDLLRKSEILRALHASAAGALLGFGYGVIDAYLSPRFPGLVPTAAPRRAAIPTAAALLQVGSIKANESAPESSARERPQ